VRVEIRGREKAVAESESDGGYDRNINDPRTLLYMIEYLHHNPVRRGLVKRATAWPWSSARFYAGWSGVLLHMDSLPVLEA
jgi:putative transposase